MFLKLTIPEMVASHAAEGVPLTVYGVTGQEDASEAAQADDSLREVRARMVRVMLENDQRLPE